MTDWALLAIGVLTFGIFLVTSSVGLWLAYKSNHFTSVDTERALKSVNVVLVGSAIFLPLIYLIYTFVKVQDKENELVMPSQKALLIITILCNLLTILACSLGIWMATSCNIWDSNSESNAVKISFIVFLVVAILLPPLYCIFYYRKEFCDLLTSS